MNKKIIIKITENHCTYDDGNIDQGWLVFFNESLKLHIGKLYDSEYYNLDVYHEGDDVMNESEWYPIFEADLSGNYITYDSVFETIKNKLLNQGYEIQL